MSFVESSLYLERKVTSVTPTVSAISFCVSSNPFILHAKYIAPATIPLGSLPLVENLSEYAPRLISMKIDTEQIGLVIGPSGKTIQGMQRLFGVEINIQEDGTVSIASPNKENAQKCKEYIKKMTATPEVGEIYEGVVTKLMDFGAFVEILPGKEGLMHISQIDNKRVEKVSDYFKPGDKVTVKLIKIENGKFSLSRKELLKGNDNKKG